MKNAQIIPRLDILTKINEFQKQQQNNISIRQMGQQSSQPEPHSARTYHYQSKQPRVAVPEHEGILKLRSTPFPNCVQISNDGMLLFLENAQTTLADLLETRFYTNRLFPVEDIERLVQNVVYTLAYMAENNWVYKDLCTKNIYYSHGVFKILPNQLIQEKGYDRAWEYFYGLRNADQEEEQNFQYLSPQLVIALRMKEKQVNDVEILNKSNVFIFGLILLEATTLLPSTQCYDPQNYDIFNNIISQRLDLVQEHYNECIARLIANMLDYDFNERMDLKQLSIWLNRELALNRKQSIKSYQTMQDNKRLSSNKSTVTMHKSRIYDQQVRPQKPQRIERVDKVERVERVEKVQKLQLPQVTVEEVKPPRIRSKTNIVYIHGYDDTIGKEESKMNQTYRGAKNYVYLENLPQYQVQYQIDKKIQQKYGGNGNDVEPNQNGYVNYGEYKNIGASQPRFRYAQPRQYQRQQLYKIPQKYPEQSASPVNNNPSRLAQRTQYVGYTPPPSSPYLKQIINRQKTPIYQLQQKPPSGSISISQSQTSKYPNAPKFYPSYPSYLQQIQLQNKQKNQQVTKRVQKPLQIIKNSRQKQEYQSKQSKQSRQSRQSDSQGHGNGIGNDGSINRIKMEIEKSRKLIQEFRKCQGIANQ